MDSVFKKPAIGLHSESAIQKNKLSLGSISNPVSIDRTSQPVSPRNENPTKTIVDNFESDKTDGVLKITHDPDNLQEILLQGTVQHVNIAEKFLVDCIVDTGSGYSYVVTYGDNQHLPMTRIEGDALTVQMADGSKQAIREHTTVSVTIQDVEMQRDFTQENVRLYNLNLCTKPRAKRPEVILGRDLINKFNMTLHGTARVSIRGVTVYEQRERESRLMLMYNDDFITDIQEMEIEPREDDRQKLEIAYVVDATAPFGRPFVRIPWRSEERPKMDYTRTLVRDKAKCRRLTEQQRELYNDATTTLLAGKFAVPLDPVSGGGRHFISVRPVYDVGRQSTKCRLCLDARVINGFTRTGPKPTTTVKTALLYFRRDPYVTTWDLTKAFWQVKYYAEELGWFSTTIQGKPLVFTSMIFGSNFSPSVLDQVLREIDDMARKYLEDTVVALDEPTRPRRLLQTCNYVDDYHCRSDGDKEEHRIGSDWMRWYLRQHGFDSSKVISNTDPTPGTGGYLGYVWNAQSDTILCKLPHAPQLGSTMTVKEVVSIVSSLFDPLGKTLRHQLMGRALIREGFTEAKLLPGDKPWTKKVSLTLLNKVAKWSEQTARLQWSEDRKVDYNELIVFSDSSTTVWSYVIFDPEYRFICARGGLLTDRTTVPQGELIALHRAVSDVAKDLAAFGPRRITFVVDSLCTLQRLRKTTTGIRGGEQRKIDEIQAALLRLATNAVGTRWEIVHIWGTHNLADVYTRPTLEIKMDDEIDRNEVRELIKNSSQKLSTEGSTISHRTQEPVDNILRMFLRSDNKEHKSRRQETDNLDPATTAEEQDVPIETRQESAEPTQEHEMFEELTPPDSEVIDVEEQIRRSHGDAHHGVQTTLHWFKRKGFPVESWSELRKFVKRFVENCEICQRTRVARHIRSAVGQAEWLGNIEDLGIASIVGVDIMTVEAKRESTYSCCLVVTCAVSKWIRAVPLVTELASEVTDQLDRLFANTRYPRVIISDGGGCFRSRKYLMFSALHSIACCRIPPHSSPYGGWYERSHKSVQMALRVLIAASSNKRWEELLPKAVHICNTHPYDITDETGLCPLDLVYNDHMQHKGRNFDSEEILKLANVVHLQVPIRNELAQHSTEMTKRQKGLLRKYDDIWRRLRNDTRARLLKAGRVQTGRDLEVGRWVRVFRPTPNKVAIQWSEPRLISAQPSAATRMVQRADGRESLEHVINLQPTQCTSDSALTSTPRLGAQGANNSIPLRGTDGANPPGAEGTNPSLPPLALPSVP